MGRLGALVVGALAVLAAVLVIPACQGASDSDGSEGGGGEGGEGLGGANGEDGGAAGGSRMASAAGASGGSRAGDAGATGRSAGGMDARGGSPGSDGGVRGGGCRNDDDCSGAMRCSTPTGDCVECLDAGDCDAEEECLANRCAGFTTCINSLDCPEGLVCDRDLSRCVECAMDADCDDGEVCGLNLCRNGCESDNDCTPLGLLCDTVAGYCVSCVSHFDCPETSFCENGECLRDICTASSTRCESNGIVTCNSWGSAWSGPVACSASETCAQDGPTSASCAPWICDPSGVFCDDDVVTSCSADGLTATEMEDCSADDRVCVGAACHDVVCDAGARFCQDNEVRQCSAKGESSTLVQTCTGQFCDASTASCADPLCEPGEAACDHNVATTCNADGSGYTGTRTNCAQVDLYCSAGECAQCAGDWGNYCGELPHFTAADQVVDGADDEFCGLPAMSGRVADLPWHPTAYDDETRPTTYVLRAGWSDAAFHAHVRVIDSTVVGYTSPDYWRGDSVQFYLAPSATLSGAFGSTQDGGARHVIITAPNSTYPSGRGVYQSSSGTYTTLSADDYEVHLTTDGYEVEVQIPWQAGALARTSGARFGFDFSITVNDTASSAPQLEGVLHNALPGTGTCVHPYCDDRAWCTPLLE